MMFRKKSKQQEEDPLAFEPTDRQKLFAACYFCVPQYKNMEPGELCKELGFKEDAFDKWCKDPYFQEWIDDQRGLFSRGPSIKKAMLEYTGMRKALEGEFNFWKPLSIREGVINPDQVNHGLNINLGAFNDFSPEQVNQHADLLLDSLCAMEGKEELGLAQSDSGSGPESNPSGTTQVQEQPMALSEGLVQNGECSLDDNIPL